MKKSKVRKCLSRAALVTGWTFVASLIYIKVIADSMRSKKYESKR